MYVAHFPKPFPDNAFVVTLFLTFKAGGGGEVNEAELREEQDMVKDSAIGVISSLICRTQSAVYLPALEILTLVPLLALQKVSFHDGGGNNQDDSCRFRPDIVLGFDYHRRILRKIGPEKSGKKTTLRSQTMIA